MNERYKEPSSSLKKAYDNLSDALKYITFSLNELETTTIDKNNDFIIPDKLFTPLVALINAKNPNALSEEVIKRHKKERSDALNKKYGSTFARVFRSKGGKYIKTNKFKYKKQKRTRRHN